MQWNYNYGKGRYILNPDNCKHLFNTDKAQYYVAPNGQHFKIFRSWDYGDIQCMRITKQEMERAKRYSKKNNPEPEEAKYERKKASVASNKIAA